MRYARVLIICAAVAVSKTAIAGEPTPSRSPDLAAPERLLSEGRPIDVPGYAAPFFGDFDGDGLADLLVGQLDFGRLRVYRNRGTHQKPLFGAMSFFRVDERVASVPTGCAVGFTPQMIDFNRDGLSDILTGSFTGAALFAFQRHPDGTFSEARVLINHEGSVQLTPRTYNSTVFAHDWDNDGDLDLLVGRGTFYLVPNEGSDEQPSYGAAVKLTVADQPFAIGRVTPVMADWDDDGLDDLIAGKGNEIVWYRNIGQAGSPAFEMPRLLLGEGEWAEDTGEGPDFSRDRPSRHPYAICVADFDLDGRLDLLLGDHYYRKRSVSDEEKAAYRLATQEQSEFRRAYRDLVKESPSLSPEEVVSSFCLALRTWQELSETHFASPQASVSMERHGGVWLYRRLSPVSSDR